MKLAISYNEMVKEFLGKVEHAHQLKNFHYPQVQKNVILS
ncbi:hypothetical protein BT246_05540 [Bacillus thuringiensis]|uniref:Uncharacterized protein n=1 Tax=Bacillus thuringiensis TaxID=1428 RepID=A0A9W3WYK0_BACTU|nr:hypothetical protein BT246_05540 [Bacillus thuringiensis]